MNHDRLNAGIYLDIIVSRYDNHNRKRLRVLSRERERLARREEHANPTKLIPIDAPLSRSSRAIKHHLVRERAPHTRQHPRTILASDHRILRSDDTSGFAASRESLFQSNSVLSPNYRVVKCRYSTRAVMYDDDSRIILSRRYTYDEHRAWLFSSSSDTVIEIIAASDAPVCNTADRCCIHGRRRCDNAPGLSGITAR